MLKIILLSLLISTFVIFIFIPFFICYCLIGNIKVKQLKKIYYLLFKK